jgi:hypothetical protein
MSFKEKVKEFLGRLKIFIWYLLTEPFRQMHDFWYLICEMLDKTMAWIYFFIIIAIIALMYGKRPVAGGVLILLLITILVWEWKSGYFMNRYRQKIQRNVQKKLEEEEPNKLEPKHREGGKWKL